jgi:hypothetical protein
MKRRKRFAVVIGVAAVGVMALGAQTAFAATYNTKLTIRECAREHFICGDLTSGGRKKCELGRRVTLFKQKPGADRKLGGTVRKGADDLALGIRLPQAKGWRVYATVSPKVGDGFVCSGDRSPILRVG